MHQLKKFLVFSFFAITLIAHTSYAEKWKYQAINMLAKQTVNGIQSYFLDLHVVDYYLEQIEPHAANYPPDFKDAKQQKFIKSKLTELINMLEVLDKSKLTNPEFLYRYAWANAMGHNLDMPGADQVAIKLFERALSAKPEHVQANYLYGVFLSQTLLKDKAIPYLKKSITNGISSAKIRLAVVYISNPKTLNDGKNLLREYIEEVPTDKYAAMMLKAVEQGNILHEYRINGKKIK